MELVYVLQLLLKVTIVAVSNINTLKCIIIEDYIQLLLKMNKGYPLEDYKEIIEAIQAVDYIESYEVPNSVTIINHFLTKL